MCRTYSVTQFSKSLLNIQHTNYVFKVSHCCEMWSRIIERFVPSFQRQRGDLMFKGQVVAKLEFPNRM
jgi:hypothetical protein